MVLLNAAVFCTIVGLTYSLEDYTFPPGFKFGVASAAFQVEGAWNISDKSESMWDWYSHTNPDRIKDGTDGDVACDSYHLWRRDIEMIEEVGAHFYRLSLAWTRILPDGFVNKISKDGAKYYSDLIDGLLEKGIEPVVTIYHWDLPQSLQNLGGWTNPLIVDWFADYARVVFSLYADRVKTWITLNEPINICEMTYNMGVLAPGIIDADVAPFLCNKYVLLAHAKAWRIYDTEFRPKYQGKVSVANHLIWIEAQSPEHEELAVLGRQSMAGRYCYPVYSKEEEGGWHPIIKGAYDQLSKEQGMRRSKLPDFTAEEVKLIQGTYDYFALNLYTSRVIYKAQEGEQLAAWPMGDLPNFRGKMVRKPEWRTTPSFWFYVYPEGLRKQLAWLKENYGDIPILITENGYPTTGGLDDLDRIKFYREYLEQILLSIKEDGVNVTGYTAWTLMDNFEWMDGYTSQYGLYQVDFSSPQRTRTPRASAAFYSKIIREHSLNSSMNVI